MSVPRHLEHSMLPPECLVYVGQNGLSKIGSARARLDEALDHLDAVADFSEPGLVEHRAQEREIRIMTSLKSPITIGGVGFDGSDISPNRITDLDRLRRLLCTCRAMFDRPVISQWTPEILHWFARRRAILGQFQENMLLGEILRTPWTNGSRIKRNVNKLCGEWDGPWIDDEEAGTQGRPMVLTVRIQDFGWRLYVDFSSMYRFGDMDPLTAMRAIASEGPNA